MREPYIFRGFEDVEQELRALVSDASYLVLQDRTDPNLDEPIGRFELTEASARAWLPLIDNDRSGGADLPLKRFMATTRSRAEPDDDDLDLGEDEGEDDELDEEEAPAERLARHDRTSGRVALSRAEILDVACWWVRKVASRNCFGLPHRRFRVRVYGHKATKTLYCGQFAVVNDGHREQLGGGRRASQDAPLIESAPPMAPAPQPAPAPARPGAVEQEGVAVGMKALGDYYAQFGQLLLGSVTRLQGLSDNVVARLDDHLKETRDQLDQVLAALVEKRFAEAQAAEERANEARTAANSDKLVKEGMGALSDVAKAMLVSKGLNPEAAELLGLLDKHPDLADALKDPHVKQMMADPQKVKDLAGTLKQVGQMAAMAVPAAQMPPAPPMPSASQASPQPSMTPGAYAPTQPAGVSQPSAQSYVPMGKFVESQGVTYQLVPIQNAAEFGPAEPSSAAPLQNGHEPRTHFYAPIQNADERSAAPGHTHRQAEHGVDPVSGAAMRERPALRTGQPARSASATEATLPSRRAEVGAATNTQPPHRAGPPPVGASDQPIDDGAWLLEGFEPRRDRGRRPRP